eukprot:CAMPEP_0206460974 /NCGR_PEP_ID=MMETSP0324_2-20121206/25060_1 /ASSEMBLY_ACC=CAM_ASM_000836 /TAXON_ID=2866 /ORGANISM="Crypthecodinium cohnii, Strain Seligo" /LENGTH=248 /DNA_ID=CAMNT_0053932757 /DNA_START=33 /DNA_END=779 /DNA_ORIENTATION=-
MPPAPPIPQTTGVANFFGWAGTLGSLLLFASPTSTFVKIAKERTTGNYALLPYTAGILNAATWVSYTAVTPDRLQTAVTNGTGVASMTVWLILFTKYSPDRGAVLSQIAAVFVIWAVLTIMAVHFITDDWFTPLRKGETCKTEFLGMFCIAFNILLYGSPLSAAKRVIETQSVANMPLPLSLATTVCSLMWSIYSILVQDAWVGLPNMAGTLLGLLQLCIYAKYCRNQEGEEERLVTPGSSLRAALRQ